MSAPADPGGSEDRWPGRGGVAMVPALGINLEAALTMTVEGARLPCAAYVWNPVYVPSFPQMECEELVLCNYLQRGPSKEGWEVLNVQGREGCGVNALVFISSSFSSLFFLKDINSANKIYTW